MRNLCILIIVSFVISGPICAQTRKIIDVHFHTRSTGDYGLTPPPNPISGKFPKAKTNEEIYNSNIAFLKKFNVVKAICSGTLIRNDYYIFKDPNRFISSLEYPDHQNNFLPDTLTFKKLFEEKKFIGFGELSLQYEGLTIEDPKFEPYLIICERLVIPEAVHTSSFSER